MLTVLSDVWSAEAHCPSVFTDDDQLSDPDYVSWEKFE